MFRKELMKKHLDAEATGNTDDTQPAGPTNAIKMDELWEMNIHLSPIDEDSQAIIRKRQQALLNSADPFVGYIH